MQLKLVLYEEDFQMQKSHYAAIPAISITIIIIAHYAPDLLKLLPAGADAITFRHQEHPIPRQCFYLQPGSLILKKAAPTE